tara:strand:- start:1299 stop:1823 length:525 start_codon:yes stop_codon:yes gene_type:complete
MDNNIKLLAIQKDLLSTDEKVVLKALKEVSKHGNPTVMPALLKATFLNGSQDVLKAGKFILYNLKDNNCVDFLFEALNDERYMEFHNIIAASIWEAGLKVDDRLLDLVELAVRLDYVTAIEISTIIENIETGFPYEEVTDASLTINEYVEDSTDENKNSLLISLAETLNGMVAG